MISPDVRITLIRTLALLIPLSWTLIGIAMTRPSPRVAGALLLAFLWNLCALLIINIVAPGKGWWTFQAEGGIFIGIPVDLLLGWALLWGPLAGLAVKHLPFWLVTLLAILLDLLIMPACAPVVQLGSNWLLGEAAAILVCLIPGLCLVQWTIQRRCLSGRAILQMFIYAGLFLFLIPAMALAHSGGSLPVWSFRTTVFLQLLFFVAVPGLSAMQEFVRRGGGTPYPYDPTQRLVTTGPYAYVRNPMQLTTTLIFVVLALLLQSWSLGLAVVMTIAYSAGIAWWHESQDTAPRFGKPWTIYQTAVPAWIPRWLPWRETPATLYVAYSCSLCSQVRSWLIDKGVTQLNILPAEQHPQRDLSRITYLDGTYEEEGIAAIGRALEHINFCWAMVGFMMRLPIINAFLQLLSDALIVTPSEVKREKSGS